MNKKDLAVIAVVKNSSTTTLSLLSIESAKLELYYYKHPTSSKSNPKCHILSLKISIVGGGKISLIAKGDLRNGIVLFVTIPVKALIQD